MIIDAHALKSGPSRLRQRFLFMHPSTRPSQGSRHHMADCALERRAGEAGWEFVKPILADPKKRCTSRYQLPMRSLFVFITVGLSWLAQRRDMPDWLKWMGKSVI